MRAAPALAPAGLHVTRQHTERSSWAASSLTKCTAGCRPGKPSHQDRSCQRTHYFDSSGREPLNQLAVDFADLPSRSI